MMLRTVELLLPALIPSWEFFKDVAPSPRIEYWIAEDGPFWREFQPRPMQVPVWKMICRLVWNPRWNDQLFMVSCAERLVLNPTEHSIEEIKQRLTATLRPALGRRVVQFRLVFVSEACGSLTRNVEYESPPFLVQAKVA